MCMNVHIYAHTHRCMHAGTQDTGAYIHMSYQCMRARKSKSMSTKVAWLFFVFFLLFFWFCGMRWPNYRVEKKAHAA
jgi:hypothetical protein